MIWNDMIWYDMIWYDMIWYDLIYDTNLQHPKIISHCKPKLIIRVQSLSQNQISQKIGQVGNADLPLISDYTLASHLNDS